jgi:hypothetical protein
MNQFATPRVFQANPSALKKKIFLAVGLAGAASLAVALVGWAPPDKAPFCFAGGITAMIFAIRFWTMQVQGGPTALTFSQDGVTIGNQASRTDIAWSDLAAITYQVSRSGHHWRFARRSGDTHEYYLDGLTGAQRSQLEETVKSIQASDIKVVPFYDPLGLADAA